MYRLLLIILLISLSIVPLSAQKYMTRSGHIWFFSHTPIEDIEAHNYQVSSILDTRNGELAFSMLIKGFQFEKALMQEHFNEKYMESDKLPKSTFTGRIKNLADIDFQKEGNYEVVIQGEISIHGVSTPLEIVGTLKVVEGKIQAKSDFSLAVADYNIKVPGIVKDNIAEQVDVHVEMYYSKM